MDSKHVLPTDTEQVNKIREKIEETILEMDSFVEEAIKQKPVLFDEIKKEIWNEKLYPKIFSTLSRPPSITAFITKKHSLKILSSRNREEKTRELLDYPKPEHSGKVSYKKYERAYTQYTVIDGPLKDTQFRSDVIDGSLKMKVTALPETVRDSKPTILDDAKGSVPSKEYLMVADTLMREWIRKAGNSKSAPVYISDAGDENQAKAIVLICIAKNIEFYLVNISYPTPSEVEYVKNQVDRGELGFPNVEFKKHIEKISALEAELKKLDPDNKYKKYWDKVSHLRDLIMRANESGTVEMPDILRSMKSLSDGLALLSKEVEEVKPKEVKIEESKKEEPGKIEITVLSDGILSVEKEKELERKPETELEKAELEAEEEKIEDVKLEEIERIRIIIESFESKKCQDFISAMRDNELKPDQLLNLFKKIVSPHKEKLDKEEKLKYEKFILIFSDFLHDRTQEKMQNAVDEWKKLQIRGYYHEAILKIINIIGGTVDNGDEYDEDEDSEYELDEIEESETSLTSKIIKAIEDNDVEIFISAYKEEMGKFDKLTIQDLEKLNELRGETPEIDYKNATFISDFVSGLSAVNQGDKKLELKEYPSFITAFKELCVKQNEESFAILKKEWDAMTKDFFSTLEEDSKLEEDEEKEQEEDQEEKINPDISTETSKYVDTDLILEKTNQKLKLLAKEEKKDLGKLKRIFKENLDCIASDDKELKEVLKLLFITLSSVAPWNKMEAEKAKQAIGLMYISNAILLHREVTEVIQAIKEMPEDKSGLKAELFSLTDTVKLMEEKIDSQLKKLEEIEKSGKIDIIGEEFKTVLFYIQKALAGGTNEEGRIEIRNRVESAKASLEQTLQKMKSPTLFSPALPKEYSELLSVLDLLSKPFAMSRNIMENNLHPH